MSKKAFAYTVFLGGCLIAFFVGLSLLSVGFLSGLPGVETVHHYENRHPIRWFALNAAFLVGIGMAVIGVYLIGFQKAADFDAASQKRSHGGSAE